MARFLRVILKRIDSGIDKRSVLVRSFVDAAAYAFPPMVTVHGWGVDYFGFVDTKNTAV